MSASSPSSHAGSVAATGIRSASGARAESRDAIGATTAMRVAADLRQRILTGEFAPGSRLKIDDIAAICAVSHMPVRGALHMLEREGVLDVLPHRGAVIRPVDARFVRNVYDLRAAIEGMLTERCAESVDSRGHRRAAWTACGVRAAHAPHRMRSAVVERQPGVPRQHQSPRRQSRRRSRARARTAADRGAALTLRLRPAAHRRGHCRASSDHARHRGARRRSRRARSRARTACAPETICWPGCSARTGAPRCASARRSAILGACPSSVFRARSSRSVCSRCSIAPNSRSTRENASVSSAATAPVSRRCSTSSQVAPTSTAASS